MRILYIVVPDSGIILDGKLFDSEYAAMSYAEDVAKQSGMETPIYKLPCHLHKYAEPS